jgi:hypothetical protein
MVMGFALAGLGGGRAAAGLADQGGLVTCDGDPVPGTQRRVQHDLLA